MPPLGILMTQHLELTKKNRSGHDWRRPDDVGGGGLGHWGADDGWKRLYSRRQVSGEQAAETQVSASRSSRTDAHCSWHTLVVVEKGFWQRCDASSLSESSWDAFPPRQTKAAKSWSWTGHSFKGGVQEPLILAYVICEQPLTHHLFQNVVSFTFTFWRSRSFCNIENMHDLTFLSNYVLPSKCVLFDTIVSWQLL